MGITNDYVAQSLLELVLSIDVNSSIMHFRFQCAV